MTSLDYLARVKVMECLEEKRQRYLDFDTEVSTQLIDQSIKSIDQTGRRCLVYRLIVFLLGMLGVERTREGSIWIKSKIPDFSIFVNGYGSIILPSFHQLH